jgi:DedD protein
MAGLRHREKLKEKVEIRLDNKQIGWLVIGCAVMAVGVFAAGYYVGIGNRPKAPKAHIGASSAPATSSAPTAKNSRTTIGTTKPAGPIYTYDKVLSAPTLPVESDDITLKLIAGTLAKSRSEEADRAATDKPDMKLAGPRPANAVAVANERVDGDAKRGPALKTRAAKTAGTNPQKTEAQIESGVRGEAPPSSAAIASKSKGYTIQIKAFRKKKEAGHFIKALKAAGYNPYLLTADIPGKGRYFRVRLGRYDTIKAADTNRISFEKSEGFKTIVIPL